MICEEEEAKMLNETEKEMVARGKRIVYETVGASALMLGGLIALPVALTAVSNRVFMSALKHSKAVTILSSIKTGPWYNRKWEMIVGPPKLTGHEIAVIEAKLSLK